MNKMMTSFRSVFVRLCNEVAMNDELFEKLSNQKFDISISHFAHFCPIGISNRLEIPYSIWVIPGTFITDSAARALSLPNMASVIPYTILDCSDRMSFMDRVKSFLFQLVDYCISKIAFISITEDESKGFQKFPNENFPHLATLAEKIQALLINGEDFLDFPRPLFTNTLHIGDIEHKHANKLNEVL